MHILPIEQNYHRVSATFKSKIPPVIEQKRGWVLKDFWQEFALNSMARGREEELKKLLDKMSNNGDSNLLALLNHPAKCEYYFALYSNTVNLKKDMKSGTINNSLNGYKRAFSMDLFSTFTEVIKTGTEANIQVFGKKAEAEVKTLLDNYRTKRGRPKKVKE